MSNRHIIKYDPMYIPYEKKICFNKNINFRLE